MVGKLVLIVAGVVIMAIVNIGVETLLQMQLAVNLGVLAMVVEHRGRISTIETVVQTEHPEVDE
jgi:hypothetical protein